MGIRTRIAGVFVLLVAVVVSLGAIAFLADFSTGLRRSLESTLRQRAERITHAAAGAGLADPSARLFVTTVADAGQSITQLVGPSGAVLVASPSAGRTPLVSPRASALRSTGSGFIERRVARLGGRWLLFVAPWPHRGERLVTGAPLDTFDDAVNRAERDVIIAASLAVLAAAAAGFVITGWALRPVERLRAEASAIVDTDDEGDEAHLLPVPGTRDELAALASTLNELISKLRGALGRQRDLVAAASHELRTPLAALHTELELARRTTDGGPDHEEALDRALGRSRRLARLASDLLVLADVEEGAQRWEGTPRPIEPVVATVLEDWRQRAAAKGIMLVLDSEGDPRSLIDRERLRQVVDNLVANAIRFAPSGTAVEVILDVADDRICLRVADRGPGFAPAFLPRAFERFSRPAGARGRSDGGAGLGLAIVKAVAESYGGTATARNREGGGAEVVVELSGHGRTA